MLLVSRSMNLWKISCITSLFSGDKLLFTPFSIVLLPICSFTSQLNKELRFSPFYLFHFCDTNHEVVGSIPDISTIINVD